jgi:thiamine biosynthesis lipoprotein
VPEVLRLATAALGTRVEIAIVAGAGDWRAAGEAALEEIETWHARLSRFSSDSLVSHLARTAHRAPVRLDADTVALFADALAVWHASGGAFDITLPRTPAQTGATPAAPARGPGPPGLAAAVAAPGADARAPCGMAAIDLDEGRWTLRLRQTGLTLDLGGIAKGHALDCAARTLREAGITAALLNGGTSSVVALGAPPGEAGWRVALGPGGRHGVVTLAEAALGVSDPSSQATAAAAGHILDPRTREPVAARRLAAVTGPSARLADAWSTALAVLGTAPAGFPQEYRAMFFAEAETRGHGGPRPPQR